MSEEIEMGRYADWLNQLCREQRPLDDITAWIEKVDSEQLETYIFHFNRNEDGHVANTETVLISKLGFEDKSSGQKILEAINKV